jgi:hypothetical protein
MKCGRNPGGRVFYVRHTIEADVEIISRDGRENMD